MEGKYFRTSVSAKAFAAGEGIAGETSFEDRLEDLRQRVMDHAIAEWSGGDLSRLGLEDGECPVRAGLIAAVLEFAFQLEQLRFQVHQERGYIAARSAAVSRFECAKMEI